MQIGRGAERIWHFKENSLSQYPLFESLRRSI